MAWFQSSRAARHVSGDCDGPQPLRPGHLPLAGPSLAPGSWGAGRAGPGRWAGGASGGGAQEEKEAVSNLSHAAASALLRRQERVRATRTQTLCYRSRDGLPVFYPGRQRGVLLRIERQHDIRANLRHLPCEQGVRDSRWGLRWKLLLYQPLPQSPIGSWRSSGNGRGRSDVESSEVRQLHLFLRVPGPDTLRPVPYSVNSMYPGFAPAPGRLPLPGEKPASGAADSSFTGGW